LILGKCFYVPALARDAPFDYARAYLARADDYFLVAGVTMGVSRNLWGRILTRAEVSFFLGFLYTVFMRNIVEDHSFGRLLCALAVADATKSLGQCMLFVGGNLKQRQEFGEHLARLRLCIGQDSRPCARCKACETRLSLHPDYFILLRPDDKRSIGVEEVSEFIRFSAMSSARGGCGVGVITEAEILTTPAANALLKLLEEPPEQFVCLLFSPHISRVLPTIRSRVQVFRLPASGSEQSEDSTELSTVLKEIQQTLAVGVSNVLSGKSSRPNALHRFVLLSQTLERAQKFARASVSPRLVALWVQMVMSNGERMRE
jgi:hypothetical protein